MYVCDIVVGIRCRREENIGKDGGRTYRGFGGQLASR